MARVRYDPSLFDTAAPAATPAAGGRVKYDPNMFAPADFSNVQSSVATRTAPEDQVGPAAPYIEGRGDDPGIPNRAQNRPVNVRMPDFVRVQDSRGVTRLVPFDQARPFADSETDGQIQQAPGAETRYGWRPDPRREEQIVPTGEAVGRAIVGGATQGYAAGSYLINDLTGDEEGRARDAEVLGAINQETGESMQGRGMGGKALIAGAQSLPLMALPLGTGVAGKLASRGLEKAAAKKAIDASVRRGLGGMAGTVYPVEYAAAREDGQSMGRAAIGAGLTTAAEVLPEVGVLGRAFAPGVSGALRVPVAVAGEALSETASELGGIAVEQAVYGRDAGDIGERLGIAALAGGGMGGIIGGAGALAETLATPPKIKTGDPDVDAGAAIARDAINAKKVKGGLRALVERRRAAQPAPTVSQPAAVRQRPAPQQPAAAAPAPPSVEPNVPQPDEVRSLLVAKAKEQFDAAGAAELAQARATGGQAATLPMGRAQQLAEDVAAEWGVDAGEILRNERAPGAIAPAPQPEPAPIETPQQAPVAAAPEAMPAPAGRYAAPEQAPAAEVEPEAAPVAVQQDAPRARGQGVAGTAFTGAGERVDFDYAVVDESSLTASNAPDGRVNPAYPREFQPRDRTTPESIASVSNIAKNLNPERLGESQDIVNGAPLIGSDGVVESGNGRVMALQGAPAERRAAYQEWLSQNAGRFGVDPATVQGMQNPVLVRVRRGELPMAERVRLGREGNRATTLGMSPTEKAKADSSLISDDMMAQWAPSEDGDPLAASNQPFIRQFLSGIGANEAAELSSNGRLTKQAADRIQAAVFAKAYGEPRLVNLFASEADPQIKNVLTALSRGAGAFARANALGASDAGLDFAADLADAANILVDAKNKGFTVKALLEQGDLMGPRYSERAVELAGYFADNARAPKRMGLFIQALGTGVESELKSRTSGDMFGRTDAGKAEILDEARKANTEQEPQARGLFDKGPAVQASDRPSESPGSAGAAAESARTADDASANARPSKSTAPATVTISLDIPKLSAGRLDKLTIPVETADGKKAEVNAYDALRRAVKRVNVLNQLMGCVRG